MPIPFEFRKDKAEHFLDCLIKGKPIPPQDSRGWTASDILELAGVCHFMVVASVMADDLYSDLKKLPQEQAGAIFQTCYNEVLTAISWCGDATSLVQGRGYDQCYEARVRAIAEMDDEEGHVRPISGFRKED